MLNQIYPPEQQFNTADTPDTEAPFSDLHLSIANHLKFMISAMTDFDIAFFSFFRW